MRAGYCPTPLVFARRLMAAGLDSLGAVDIAGMIADHFGLETLNPSVLFDYPTVAAIAAYTGQCKAQRLTPETVRCALSSPPEDRR